MRQNRFPKYLDYMPPIIAFMAAVMAVVGSPKWNEKAVGFAKITPLGWLVLVIGFLALLATLLITVRNRREQGQQREARERISAIGKNQLLVAIRHTVHPFTNYRDWARDRDHPRFPRDLLDPIRRETLASLDLTARSPYMDGSCEEIKWHQIIQRAANEGSANIVTALQIYSTYFSVEIIEAVTQYLNSEFLRIHLAHITDIVDVNVNLTRSRGISRPIPFLMAKSDEMHSHGYKEFWEFLERALVVCGAGTLLGQPYLDAYHEREVHD